MSKKIFELILITKKWWKNLDFLDFLGRFLGSQISDFAVNLRSSSHISQSISGFSTKPANGNQKPSKITKPNQNTIGMTLNTLENTSEFNWMDGSAHSVNFQLKIMKNHEIASSLLEPLPPAVNLSWSPLGRSKNTKNTKDMHKSA